MVLPFDPSIIKDKHSSKHSRKGFGARNFKNCAPRYFDFSVQTVSFVLFKHITSLQVMRHKASGRSSSNLQTNNYNLCLLSASRIK